MGADRPENGALTDTRLNKKFIIINSLGAVARLAFIWLSTLAIVVARSFDCWME
jgi:hypothetical protein